MSLDLRLAAPPADGAANRLLLRVIAELLGVPRRDLSIIRGASARQKTVHVRGVALEVAQDRLDAALAKTEIPTSPSRPANDGDSLLRKEKR